MMGKRLPVAIIQLSTAPEVRILLLSRPVPARYTGAYLDLGGPMPLLENYEEASLLWTTKGWGIVAVAKQLAEDPKLAEFKFSQPTLSRRVDDREPIPPVVAEAIEALETRRGRQRRVHIVEEGLRVAHGQPSQRQAQEIALALLAHLPTNDLALKLADALLAQAQVANGSGSLLDVFAHAIAGRVPHIDTARLARIIAKRIARSTLSFGRLAVVAGMASAVGCGAWFLLDKTQGRSKPAYAPVAPVMVYMAGSAPIVFDLQSLLAAPDMGEKPLDQSIPPGPLPGQRVPPCDAGLAQAEINGGCWFESGAAKPPCGRLFRSGDKCFVPVAADPKKPVGGTSKEPR